jgi:hypothetical protein
VDAPEEDFKRLCEELGAEKHISNKDTPRGTTLLQDNVRYLKLTRYILQKNLRHVVRKLSFK